MIRSITSLVVLAAILAAQIGPTWSENGHGAQMPYAGFQERSIKSLSDQDIDDLKNGRGWGLALPAELNGLPGPLHLLELQDELALSEDQIAQIQSIFDVMRQEAIAAGNRYLLAEQALDQAFATGNIDQANLERLINAAEMARAELRTIHLSRHLMTPDILTSQQVKRYAMLRGYTNDPCAMVPDGHNAEMWRKHNNCD